jgi:hypothetical protein
MRKMLFSMLFLLTMAVAGQNAAAKFDGAWNTTVTCDPKGGSLGYTWHFVSTVTGNALHGERGAQGQPAYLAIDGKIGDDGKAKLTANGVVGSTEYTHGPFVQSGAQYSYEVKSEFSGTEGKGERSTGLGIYGRPCHWTFEKQAAANAPQKP